MNMLANINHTGDGNNGPKTIALLPPEKQKVVVHGRDSAIKYGVAIRWANRQNTFSLNLCDRNGNPLHQSEEFLLNQIKALFYVQNFSGNPIPFASTKQSEAFSGNALAMQFKDGEVIIGHPPHYHDNSTAPYYLVIPEEDSTNNLLVLADRSSVAGVYTAEDYFEQQQDAFKNFLQEHFMPGMTMEECLGAYYFGKQDYNNALRHFRHAQERAPYSDSIQKKLCATQYNLGMRHIKQKDYETALFFLDSVLAMDPGHQEARNKIAQIHEYLHLQENVQDRTLYAAADREEKQKDHLHSLEWFKRRHTCIFIGSRGVGKSYLAIALGHKVHNRGHSVAYHRVFTLLENLSKAKAHGRYPQLLGELWEVELLILDEWARCALLEEQIRDLLIILAERHQRRATIIISDIAPDRWRTLLGGQPMADTLISRIVEESHKIIF